MMEKERPWPCPLPRGEWNQQVPAEVFTRPYGAESWGPDGYHFGFLHFDS